MTTNSSEALVSLVYGISPPCGDGSLLNLRKTPLNSNFFIEPSCSFEMKGSPIHPDYYSTGLT